MPLLKNNTEKAMLTRYSSFMVVENTLNEVVQLLLQNDRLKRLLYYTDPKALHLPKLTPHQTMEMLGKQIRIVPRLEVAEDARPYIILTMDNFVPAENQTTFRSCQLGVDIICPYDYWSLEDFKLRPYSIAGEVDAMLNKSTVTSLGIADFVGAKMLMMSPDIGGLSLYYHVESFKDDIKLNKEPV